VSGFGAIRAEVDPGPGEKRRDAARLVVCNHADGADDAAMLLDILGLLPEPDPTAPGGRR